MPKRRCPFPQNTNQMKMHIDMRHVGKEEYQKEVYAKTKNLLMMGAIEASKSRKSPFHSEIIPNGKGKQVIGPALSRKATYNKCLSCGNKDNTHLLACEFCEQKVCRNCCRVCVECEKNFCHVCSVINYDLRDEREFCLSCAG